MISALGRTDFAESRLSTTVLVDEVIPGLRSGGLFQAAIKRERVNGCPNDKLGFIAYMTTRRLAAS